jgi:hypothetical protein
MAIALHRLQNCLWKAPKQPFLSHIVGARWVSNPQTPLSDIEASRFFFFFFFFSFFRSFSSLSLHVVREARDTQDIYAEAIARVEILEIRPRLCTFTDLRPVALADSDSVPQTDHMLLIPWESSKGWGTPEIKPCACCGGSGVRHFDIDKPSFFLLWHQDGPLSLEPSATVFHYAQCLFEGLKAYRNKNGKITLFRPDLNMTRMNRSAHRLALPVRLVDEANDRD